MEPVQVSEHPRMLRPPAAGFDSSHRAYRRAGEAGARPAVMTVARPQPVDSALRRPAGAFRSPSRGAIPRAADLNVGELIGRLTTELAVELPGTYRSATYQLAKRAVDIAGAAVLLTLLAPLFLVTAVAIWLDSPGPAFFVQGRIGKGGRIFPMIKFRTMVRDSGVRLSGPHKRQDDDRVTRVGRVLRKSSLDEVPQLINVLLGHMSLVGPRPELPEIVLAHYQPWQFQRFLVPQGMTGWWQVTGRGTKLLYEHTEDDLYYIEHASFWFDLGILLKTIPAVLHRDGAF